MYYNYGQRRSPSVEGWYMVWMINDGDLITEDECGPNFLTFVLRLRENPGKTSTRKFTRPGIELGSAAWEVTTLDHSDDRGWKKYENIISRQKQRSSSQLGPNDSLRHLNWLKFILIDYMMKHYDIYLKIYLYTVYKMCFIIKTSFFLWWRLVSALSCHLQAILSCRWI